MTNRTISPYLTQAFTRPFEGKENQKNFWIGAAVSLAGMVIPIIPWLFIYGYITRIVRMISNGEDWIMPEWNSWGKLAEDGLKMMVANLVILFPGITLMIIGVSVYFGGYIGMMTSIIAEGETKSANMLPIFLFFVSFLILMAFMFLGSVLTTAGSVFVPPVLVEIACQNKLSAILNFSGWFKRMRQNWLSYFIVWMILWGLVSILYFLYLIVYTTVIFTVLLPLVVMPVMFYVSVVAAVLFGDVLQAENTREAPVT